MVQILSILCSFWENLAKSYVGATSGDLAPPPGGNPGSATECKNVARDRDDHVTWKQIFT